ncbi:MAG: flagellar biosynthesis protein FlhF [Pirellulales bacterium]|nr:flagellar biosynthesis protein FlhF [Pirellulales bacterium]
MKTFRAATMQEALSLVRSELGPDAAVLHTRLCRPAGLLGWLPGRRGIEVIASRDVNVPSRLPSRMAPRRDWDDARPEPPRGAPVPPAAAAPAELPPAAHHELKTQISELQAMVARLYQNAEPKKSTDLQPGLFTLFTNLIEAEVGETIARQLIERVRQTAAPNELADSRLVQARLEQLLQADVRASGPIAPPGDRCHTVALIGPTGVGKTTTIAKLAANFRLRERRRVGLITVDTYRVAAVEQLRTYAEIIDLPMEVVSTPREMRAAVDRLSDQELVLVDTAGRSPTDEVRIQELRALLNEARAAEVHLVLSSVASANTLKRTIERFACALPTSLLFTKLDEALACGNLLEVLLETGLPVSYLTDGQNVPDDIQSATPAELVSRLLTAATTIA